MAKMAKCHSMAKMAKISKWPKCDFLFKYFERTKNETKYQRKLYKKYILAPSGDRSASLVWEQKMKNICPCHLEYCRVMM